MREGGREGGGGGEREREMEGEKDRWRESESGNKHCSEIPTQPRPQLALKAAATL